MTDTHRKCEPNTVSCEFESTEREPVMTPSVSFLKFQGPRKLVNHTTVVEPVTWMGVTPQEYKQSAGDWAHVSRQVIIGDRGEATQFHLRYFEIGPGGHTTLEKHRHSHVIIGIRGSGFVVAGRECYEMSFLDTLYVAPDVPHQLINEHDQPFGFFCLVDAQRDRPGPVSRDDLKTILRSLKAREKVKIPAGYEAPLEKNEAEESQTPLIKPSGPSDL